MPLAIDTLADHALVAFLNADGSVRGSGFLVQPDSVLTCHHVVDSDAPVLLRDVAGSIHPVSRDAIVSAPGIDLAAVRTPTLPGSPLALAPELSDSLQFWTKGFHRLGSSIRAGFPVQGTITGTTSVTYSTFSTVYAIDGVLVLRDDDIDPGLSGAPVLDRAAGAVIGVVSTRLTGKGEHGGFAIPIRLAAADPALASVVARNAESVPAYGALLNVPAARDLCAAVTMAAISELATLRKVDLVNRVARAEIADTTRRFLSGTPAILALIGSSGVGKSTELAALAQRADQAVVLLRGSAMHRDCQDLGAAIAAALSRAGDGLVLPANPDRALARVLAPNGGLLVLFDGFNEAPLSGHLAEEWIAGTRAWLRDTSARLVISCRPELWKNVGDALVEPIDGRANVVVSLGDFNDHEYQQALAAYDLPSTTDWSILRLPLALSLYARSASARLRTSGSGLSVNDVVEAYAQESSRRLAVATSAGSSDLIQDRLGSAAAVMWESDSDTIDSQMLDQVFGRSLADGVLAEGLMTRAADGYRFVYDDLADWLKAQSLDLDAELTAIQADSQYSWRRTAPVSYALRAVERQAGSAALGSRLIELLRSSPDVDSQAFQTVADTLTKIADAQPYRSVLQAIIDLTAADDSEIIKISSIRFWRDVPLPGADKMAYLRSLVRLDDHYMSHFRPKDWARWAAVDLSSNFYYSALALRLAAQDPDRLIPALDPWLEDETPLAAGNSAFSEASVADVAMGILFRLRGDHARLAWRAIVRAGIAKCDQLIGRISADDPAWLAQAVLGSDVQDDSAAVVHCGFLLMRASLPDQVIAALRRRVADKYATCALPDALHGEALMMLSNGQYAEVFVPDLVKAYEEGRFGIDEWALWGAAQGAGATAHHVILPVLLRALASAGTRGESALAALAAARDPDIQAVADANVLRLLDEGTLTLGYPTVRYVEDRLWSGSVATADLIALARRVIHTPAGCGRGLLAYPLTEPAVLGGDGGTRAALLSELIDSPGDPDAFEEVVGAVAAGFDNLGSAAALHIVKQVIGHLERPKADRLLFGRAFVSDDLARALAGWLVAGDLAPPGKLMTQLRRRARGGVDAPVAIRQILEGDLQRKRRS